MQWYGGSNSSSAWRDMVYTNCNSTYEIKSKENVRPIVKGFAYNNFYGGSYHLYHQIVAERTKQPTTHYIVFVSHEYDWPEKGPAFYQVEIAEINKVLP